MRSWIKGGVIGSGIVAVAIGAYVFLRQSKPQAEAKPQHLEEDDVI